MYLLGVDVGNTNIVLGILNGPKVVKLVRLSTDRSKTNYEFLIHFKQLMDIFEIDVQDIEGGILSSVVPEVTLQVEWAMEHLLGKKKKVLTLGRDEVKTGLVIDIDTPATLGKDRIADAVGALHELTPPIIIVDMGTATTISVLNEQGHHIGGLIIPGARTSLNSLSEKASQLPFISIEAPENLIARNTVDCMKSGIVYGYASMLDGLIDRITEQLGQKATVIATGGLSSLIIPYCKHKITYEKSLLLKGLYYIYRENCHE